MPENGGENTVEDPAVTKLNCLMIIFLVLLDNLSTSFRGDCIIYLKSMI